MGDQKPLQGLIQITDGRVVVHPLERGGRRPTIAPGTHVCVLVNGEEVSKPTPVGPDDVVEVSPENRPAQLEYDIRVSDDGLEAFLAVRSVMGQVIELLDTPPQPDLRPRGIVRERTRPPSPSRDEILSKLQEHAVSFGIDAGAIEEIAAGSARGRRPVARGTSPTPGRDASVEFHFAFEKRPILDPETGRVNFFAADEIPWVTPGAVVATYRPPVPGTPGMTVNGEEIFPPQPRDLRFQAGEGTRLSPEGDTILATREGRPCRKGDLFVVSPVMMVEGDVDIESGNIVYKGDVVVTGNVEERLSVHAAGRIEVYGSAIQARLTAQGDIRVARQVIGGRLVAGTTVVYRTVLRDLETLVGELGKVGPALLHLRGAFAGKKAAPPPEDRLLRIVLGQALRHVPETARRLLEFLEGLEAPLEIDIRPHLKEVLRLSGVGGEAQSDGVAALAHHHAALAEAAETLRAIDENPAHVIAGSMQGAEVLASGDVFVLGHGGYQSQINARGRVVVAKRFRGGSIKAEKSVYVGELGSSGGAMTHVSVPQDERVYLKRAFPGSVVRVGTAVWESRGVTDNAVIHVDKDGAAVCTGGIAWSFPAAPA